MTNFQYEEAGYAVATSTDSCSLYEFIHLIINIKFNYHLKKKKANSLFILCEIQYEHLS